jgi:hypothetical protein
MRPPQARQHPIFASAERVVAVSGLEHPHRCPTRRAQVLDLAGELPRPRRRTINGSHCTGLLAASLLALEPTRAACNRWAEEIGHRFEESANRATGRSIPVGSHLHGTPPLYHLSPGPVGQGIAASQARSRWRWLHRGIGCSTVCRDPPGRWLARWTGYDCRAGVNNAEGSRGSRDR